MNFGPSWAGERHVFGVAKNLGQTWCQEVSPLKTEEGG